MAARNNFFYGTKFSAYYFLKLHVDPMDPGIRIRIRNTACHLQAFLLKKKKKSYTYFDSPARGKSNKPKSFEGYKFPMGTTTKRGDILPD
jgi:hypothetical protein